MEFTQEELANEEWRDVVSYEGLYQVSSLGRVIRISDKKMLKPVPNYNGYYVIGFKRKQFRLSRVVATAFISNPKNEPFVDHIDSDRANNRASNLRWCTQKDNMNNPITISRLRNSKLGANNPNYGKRPSQEMRDKLSKAMKSVVRSQKWLDNQRNAHYKKQVLLYTINGEFVKQWDSIKDVCIYLGISQNSASKVLTRKQNDINKTYLLCYANDTKRIAEIENLRKKSEKTQELFAN